MDLLTIFLVWVVGCGLLAYLLRDKITHFFIEYIHLPPYINFLLIALPFVVVEEALTCGSFPSCLTITLPAFWVHLSFFYVATLMVKILRDTYWLSIFVYGIWGSVSEFVINSKYVWVSEHGAFVFSVLVVFNTLIYMVIVIVPLHYLQKHPRLFSKS